MKKKKKMALGVTWMRNHPTRPNNVVVSTGDGQYETGIPPEFEDPQFLRDLADLIEAGPPYNAAEVERIYDVLISSGRLEGEHVSREDIRLTAVSLWRGGVRPS